MTDDFPTAQEMRSEPYDFDKVIESLAKTLRQVKAQEPDVRRIVYEYKNFELIERVRNFVIRKGYKAEYLASHERHLHRVAIEW